MKINCNYYKGIVISAKANYLNVDIDIANSGVNNLNTLRLLCTRRSRLNYLGKMVNVGDRVLVESVDLLSKKGVVTEVEDRISWLSRPPVANVTNIVVVIALSHPDFDLDQTSRFLITAEQNL